METEKITNERLFDAIIRRDTALDNPGFCIKCGAENDGCEPDAEGYDCDVCGAEGTVSAPEMLLLGI